MFEIKQELIISQCGVIYWRGKLECTEILTNDKTLVNYEYKLN